MEAATHCSMLLSWGSSVSWWGPRPGSLTSKFTMSRVVLGACCRVLSRHSVPAGQRSVIPCFIQFYTDSTDELDGLLEFTNQAQEDPPGSNERQHWPRFQCFHKSPHTPFTQCLHTCIGVARTWEQQNSPKTKVKWAQTAGIQLQLSESGGEIIFQGRRKRMLLTIFSVLKCKMLSWTFFFC